MLPERNPKEGQYTYHLLDGVPCRVWVTEDNMEAEQYIPGEGFAPASLLDILMESQPLSEEAFKQKIVALRRPRG